MRCPCCEGIGEIPEASLETMLEAAASRLGYVMRRKPGRVAKPPVPEDAIRAIVECLDAARRRLNFGGSHYTGSVRQLQFIKRPFDEGFTQQHWEAAINSQAAQLQRALEGGRLSRDEVSRYLSLQTISRNFDSCLARVEDSASVVVRLSDGTWAEIDRDGRKRIIPPSEAGARGLK